MAESKRVLEPVERIFEVLFGLIIVLTFTCTLSIRNADRNTVHEMLTGAAGCSLAWALIDSVFYLLGCLSERGHNLLLFRRLRAQPDPARGEQLIREVLPPLIASQISSEELKTLAWKLKQLPEPPQRPRVTARDIKGSVGVFLLAFGSIFPVIIPFTIMSDPRLALRISNAIAIVFMFMAGVALGRYASNRPWAVGLAMVVFGIALVGIAIVLGG